MKILILTIFNLIFSPVIVVSTDDVKTASLAERAEKELIQVLKTQSEFVKAHAAEYLIWLGKEEEVRRIFLNEDKLYHNLPKYRIVVWRVLWQTENSKKGKMKWANQIFRAFADEHGQDRIHAAETLAKLGLSPMTNHADATKKILATERENPFYLYTLWASSQTSRKTYETNKVRFLHFLLNSTKDDVRRISAFILRREGGLTPVEWTTLAETALSESGKSPMKKTLLNTTIATAPPEMQTSSLYSKAKQELLTDFVHMPASIRMETSLVLADYGTPADLPLLADFMTDKSSKGIYDSNGPLAADVRATAAYAILKIEKEFHKHIIRIK